MEDRTKELTDIVSQDEATEQSRGLLFEAKLCFGIAAVPAYLAVGNPGLPYQLPMTARVIFGGAALMLAAAGALGLVERKQALHEYHSIQNYQPKEESR